MRTVAYVGSIALVNLLFCVVPMVATPWGPWSVGTLLVGACYLLRDGAQLELGKWRVLQATAIGIGVSYVGALFAPVPPAFAARLAASSAAAFALGELLDWAAFTALEGRSLRARYVASSLVGVPADTLLFLGGIGGLNAPMFALGTASKLLALAFVWRRSCER